MLFGGRLLAPVQDTAAKANHGHLADHASQVLAPPHGPPGHLRRQGAGHHQQRGIAHLAGAHVSDIIAEPTLALQLGATARDLAKTIQDPLAAKVRSDLRRLHNFSKNPARKFGVECVFSTEQLSYPDGNGGTCQAKAASDGNMKMDCASGFGAVTPVTATFGLVAASRVLKKIAERGARAEKEAGNEDTGSIGAA